MRKTILLIGGAGFIGANIIRRLDKDKFRILVVEPEGAYTGRLDGMAVELLYGSLNNIDFIKSCIEQYDVKIVVHLVSMLIPGSTYEEYKREYKDVIFPSIELMEICALNGVRFVYFSSGGTVYGNKNDVYPFVETDMMKPISYYGWSKQMMENSIHFMHRTQGLDYLILRPSNPYGHGQNLYGKQGRDVHNTTLNIGSGRGYSVNDVLAFLKIVSQQDFKIVYQNPRPVDVSNMVLDVRELKKLVDVELTPFMDGIMRFYEESKSETGK